MTAELHARTFTVILATLVGMTGLACARTITVGKGLGYDYGHIHLAINAAQEGDTVVVAAGVYQTNIDFQGKNIVLTSTNPNAQNVTIDFPGRNSAVVTFSGQEDANCELIGFGITGGRGDEGGGICGNGTKATIRQCAIYDNHADVAGGGIHDCDGVISDCRIQDNRAENSAGFGQGGGLYGCDGLISNCTIIGNLAGHHEQRFSHGGGLSECASVVNCFVKGNTAGGFGGGLYNCAQISNCTIVVNEAGRCGGGVSHANGSGAVLNSLIWRNRADQGEQAHIECRHVDDFTVSYSNVQGGFEGAKVAGECLIQWGPTNLDRYPLFAERHHLGEYHLREDSPCVDAGDPNGDYQGQTDMDGQIRVAGGRVDVGADEYVLVTPLMSDLEIDGPATVSAGSAVQYRAVATYDDGSSRDVTAYADWSIQPDDIGVMDADGLFSLRALDGPVNTEVLAEYKEEGITEIAGKTVLCRPATERVGKIYVDGVNGSDLNFGFTRSTALKSIQRGIDLAQDGEIVLVYPDVYTGEIRFLGKAISVRSAEAPAILQNPGDFAVTFIYGEGSGSVLKNFVIRNSLVGVFMAGSSPRLENLTIVDNESGLESYEGQPRVGNCIVWGNSRQDVVGCSPRYSCVERSVDGQGNISVDPLFVGGWTGLDGRAPAGRGRAYDYHLRSQAGRWDSYDQIWTTDDVTSPCIDAGDPQGPLGYEVFPNGGRINMGAYGGTPRASKSYFGEAPCATVIAGDINGDCRVDFRDLAILSAHWLQRAMAERMPSELPDAGR